MYTEDVLRKAVEQGAADIFLIPGMPLGLSIAFFVPAGLCLLLILSAVRALKERFREIEGGELDAAGQY